MAEPIYTADHLSDLVTAGTASVGAYTYGTPAIRHWPGSGKLRIGRYGSIAEGVIIFLSGNHRTDWVTTYPFSAIETWPEAQSIPGHPATRGDVIIGNDVWLGESSVILSGVTIGDGAVVGTRAVVTRDVPPYAIVAGCPAKLVRNRFKPSIVKRLLRIRWWDRPNEEVKKAMPMLLNQDIAAFVDRFDQPRRGIGAIRAALFR